MFTGIVSDIGEVIAAEGDRKILRRYRIRTAYDAATIPLGASIACAGICLTVVERGTGPQGHWFDVQTAAETLSRTLAGSWEVGTKLNLERSLKVGDELGGHLVTGHVDGIGYVESRDTLTDPQWGGESARIAISVPAGLARFIAEKGSVAVDGASLTVNAVHDDGGVHRFSVVVIPHTLAVTALGALRPQSQVHIEIDLMARYAARLAEAERSGY
jgi:riboflavin synthase